MNILGINIFHADTSACIIKDSTIVAAVEEERFSRIKHFSGFPKNSINYCLKEANLSLDDIDYISVNFNTKYNFLQKLSFLIRNLFSINFIPRITLISKRQNIKKLFNENFNTNIKSKIINVPHHYAHISSSYLCSGFDESLGLSFDGTGDFSCLELYNLKKEKISVLDKICFPHSLGIFYQTVTQYLGFKNYGDEYKIMGLAAYGQPKYVNEMYKLFHINKNNKYKLNLKYFLHHLKSFSYYFENGAPYFDNFFNSNFEKLFKQKSRIKNEKITEFHKDIASSAQHVFEQIIILYLSKHLKDSNHKNLCLSGGCAFNSLLMGKLKKKFPDLNLFIQPNSGDAGGAIGAALYVDKKYNKNFTNNKFTTPYLGPSYSNDQIRSAINEKISQPNNEIEIKYHKDFKKLTNEIAKFILDGKVVGWFQGRMEWGPRALGNRSILANPAIKNMKDIINAKIKKREDFRPFAPSILETHYKEYFESKENLEFMGYVVNVVDKKIAEKIPSVVHSDGTARVQLVKKNINPKFHQLIESFNELSGIPLLLNTSLNVDEPICESPLQAISSFTASSMDILVMENFVLIKKKI